MRALEILLELDVVNTDAVKATCDQFAAQVHSAPAKKWFQRTLFRYFVNQPEHNRPFRPADMQTLDMSGVPDGLRQKMASADQHDLFVFQPKPEFLEDINNVVHWIQFQEHQGDTRALEKLPKMVVPVALQKAQQWNTVGKATQASLAGIENLHGYPDGYYWGRITTRVAMEAAGAVLQNCLRHGHYWSMVESGQGNVYVLRDPQHEEHVAVATRGQSIVECKGKNNKPVNGQYLPYVAHLFNTLLRDYRPTDSYIKAAGLYSLEGRWGTIRQIGKHTKISNGLDVYQADTTLHIFRGEQTVARAEIRTSATPTIQDLEIEAAENADDLATALNELGMPSDSSVRGVLHDVGVFFRDGRYGRLEDIADRIVIPGTEYVGFKTADLFQVRGPAGVLLTLMYDRSQYGAGQEVQSIQGKVIPAETLVAALNALGLPVSSVMSDVLVQRYRIHHTGNRYSLDREEVAKRIAIEGFEIASTDRETLLRQGGEEKGKLLHTSGGVLTDISGQLEASNAVNRVLVAALRNADVIDCKTTELWKSLRDSHQVILNTQQDPARFDLITEAAAKLGEFGDVAVFDLPEETSRNNLPPVIRAYDVTADPPRMVLHMWVTRSEIHEVRPSGDFIRDDRQSMVRVLNLTDVPPGKNVRRDLEKLGIVAQGTKYGLIDEHSTEDFAIDLDNLHAHKVGDKWFVTDRTTGQSVCSVETDGGDKMVDLDAYNLGLYGDIDVSVAKPLATLLDRAKLEPHTTEALYGLLKAHVLYTNGHTVPLAEAKPYKSINGQHHKTQVYQIDDNRYLLIVAYEWTKVRGYYLCTITGNRTVKQFLELPEGEAPTDIADIVAGFLNDLKVAGFDDEDLPREMNLYQVDDTFYSEHEYLHHLSYMFRRWDGKELSDVIDILEKFRQTVQNSSSERKHRYYDLLHFDSAEHYDNYPDEDKIPREYYSERHQIFLVDSHGDGFRGYTEWDTPVEDWDTMSIAEIEEEFETERNEVAEDEGVSPDQVKWEYGEFVVTERDDDEEDEDEDEEEDEDAEDDDRR